ncbi:MAG TPA: hypothetical protein VGF53_18080 [Pseudolabrys sp.]|jgi:hypothetical protein
MNFEAQRRSAVPTAPDDAFQMSVAQKTRKSYRPWIASYFHLYSISYAKIIGAANYSLNNPTNGVLLPQPAKMIEFSASFAAQPAGKPIFEAYGTNSGFRVAPGASVIDVRQYRAPRSSRQPQSNHLRALRITPIARARATHRLIHKRICAKIFCALDPIG